MTHFKNEDNGEIETDQICSYQLNKLSINRPVSDEIFTFKPKDGIYTDRIETNKIELKQGDYFPNLDLLSINEDAIPLSSLKGQISILEFGYIGCGPCLLAANELKKSYKTFKDNDKVKFYYINPRDKISLINEYTKKENVAFEILIGNERTVNAFGIDSYPRIFIIDHDLKIAKIFIGYSGLNMGNEITEEILKIMR